MTISLLRKVFLAFHYLINKANRLTLVIFILFYASCLCAGNSSYFDQWEKNQLPDNYPASCDEIFIPNSRIKNSEDLKIRKEFGAYFYPSKKWMDKAAEKLKQNGWRQKKRTRGHEIMAGSGWLSYFLSVHYGFTMTATDFFTRNYIYYKSCSHRPDFEVHYKDARQAIKDDSEAEFLVLSWPYSPDKFGDDALDALKEWNKRGPVLYIGQQTAGGDTGSCELDYFFYKNYKAVHLDSDYIPAKLKGMEGLLNEDSDLRYTWDYPTVYIPSDEIHTNSDIMGHARPRRIVKEEF